MKLPEMHTITDWLGDPVGRWPRWSVIGVFLLGIVLGAWL